MAEEDFDIDSLAAYLHLMPPQVARMAERDRLPGRKVAGQWRFSRAEIHHWLESRMGADEESLSQVEGVLERTADPSESPLTIGSVVPVEAIAVPLAARTRSSVMSSMVELAAETGHLWDTDKMLQAIQSREEMQPTALDIGVALLHPRRPMSNILGEEFVALGRTNQGIPFGAARGGLTDLFFLVCSASDRWHLRVLARLSRLLAAPGFLEELREVPEAQTAHELLVAYDEKLPN
jgi:PTS system nitrogen regulatory IIA component